MNEELEVLKIETALKNGILSTTDIVLLTDTTLTYFEKTHYDLSKPIILVVNIPGDVTMSEDEKQELLFKKTYDLKAIGFKDFNYKFTQEESNLPLNPEAVEVTLDQYLKINY